MSSLLYRMRKMFLPILPRPINPIRLGIREPPWSTIPLTPPRHPEGPAGNINTFRAIREGGGRFGPSLFLRNGSRTFRTVPDFLEPSGDSQSRSESFRVTSKLSEPL